MGILPKKSELKARIAHGIAGLTIAIEGLQRFDENDAIVGVVMVSLGLMLIAYGFLLKRLHQSRFILHLEAGVLSVEAIVFGLIAAHFFEHGKHLLPWLYVALSIVYLALAAYRFVHGRKVVTH